MEETCYALSSNFWELATDYFFFGVPIGIFFELLEDVGILDFDGLMLPVENPLLSKVLHFSCLPNFVRNLSYQEFLLCVGNLSNHK